MRQSTSDFIQRSIFSHRPALFASIDDPEQHVYDDFQDDIPFEGIAYFAHLNKTNCFSPTSDGTFDIGIVGAPFDLGVTYRPGARFGPAAARTGSRRLSPSMGYRCVSRQCKALRA
jgi:agmatinase